MQVIMLKDVVGVGQKGTIQNVSDGFAMNRLLPGRLAEMVTPEKLKALKIAEKSRVESEKMHEALSEATARQLQDAKVTVRVNANEQGHLYEHLPSIAIAERIQKELGISVPPKAIQVQEPIKTIGRTNVHILLGKKTALLAVFVERA